MAHGSSQQAATYAANVQSVSDMGECLCAEVSLYDYQNTKNEFLVGLKPKALRQ
jgi:hypothetical protein